MLAEELSADLLLVDDKQARKAAIKFGIAITGILGILDRAQQEDLIDLEPTLEKLQKTNFHIADDSGQQTYEEIMKNVEKKAYEKSRASRDSARSIFGCFEGE